MEQENDPLLNPSDEEEDRQEQEPMTEQDRNMMNKITDQRFTLFFQVCGAVLFSLALIVRYDKDCQKAFDLIFLVFVLFLLILRIPLSIFNLYLLLYKKVESKTIVILGIVFEVMQVGWAIYSNIIYYQRTNTQCRFYLPAGIYMLYVYYLLYKMCIFLLVAIIIIPCFLIGQCIKIRKRAKLKRMRDQLVNKLVREKFDASVHGEEAECSICLEWFKAKESVTILPCDERHLFHHACVKRWFKEDVCCPLCKEKVSLAKIDSQISFRKSSLSSRKSSINKGIQN